MFKLASLSLIFLFVCVNAFGQPSRLRWERTDDIGPQDGASAVVVSGNNVIVAGSTAPGGGAGMLRAFNKGTGALSWSHALAFRPVLAASDGRVYESTSTVSAYADSTGAILWTSPPLGFQVNGIVANLHAVVLTGASGSAGVVRAYDPVDGHFLWQDVSATTSSGPAVAIDGFNVFVSGETVVAGIRTMAVRCFDARTGVLRWTTTRPNVQADALAVGPSRLYLAGSSGLRSGDVPMGYIAALETGSGDLLWQDASQVRTFLLSIAVRGTSLIVGGAQYPHGVLRAYHADSGAPLWANVVPAALDFNEMILDVAAGEAGVYAVGISEFMLGQGSIETTVRAYDLTHGNLQYEDRALKSIVFGGSGALPQATLDGGLVFAAGSVRVPSGYDLALRTYEFSDVESLRVNGAPEPEPRTRVRR